MLPWLVWFLDESNPKDAFMKGVVVKAENAAEAEAQVTKPTGATRTQALPLDADFDSSSFEGKDLTLVDTDGLFVDFKKFLDDKGQKYNLGKLFPKK